MLINVKMPTIGGIYKYDKCNICELESKKSFFIFHYFVFYKFHAFLS